MASVFQFWEDQNIVVLHPFSQPGSPDGQLPGTGQWPYIKDETAAEEWLKYITQDWASLEPNGSISIDGTDLILSGKDPLQNIFTIDVCNILGNGESFQNIRRLFLEVPDGATVLVNINGKSLDFRQITLQKKPQISDTPVKPQNILWNFPETLAIYLDGEFYGTILAPFASVMADYGSFLYGALFAENLFGILLSENVPFKGTLSEVISLAVFEDSFGEADLSAASICPAQDIHSSCHQAISNLIESVALEEAALSHILNAEGEKIQRVLTMDTSAVQLLQVNDSVREMVNMISYLEMVLEAKLETIADKSH